jgi:predicted transcriptional regulator
MTGPELRERRQRLGISARALGTRARVSYPCITRFEQGKRQPLAKNLQDIEAAITAFEREKSA